jgi:hypothetical protein
MPVTAAKPALSRSADKPGLAAAKSTPSKPAHEQASTAAKPQPKKTVDKLAVAHSQPVTKRVQLAKTDPLAPLPEKHSGRTKDSPTGR